MKKITIIILLFITLVSCESTNNTVGLTSTRIHRIETSKDAACNIIEVDGHEYLVSWHGGAVHLESCPCKNK